MRARIFASVLQMVGVAMLTAVIFTVDTRLGYAALGGLLFVVGLLIERDSAPSQRAREGR